jgi:glycosyltransferase involved in cell wall biosynthesis
VKVLWFVNVPFPPVDRALQGEQPFTGSGWWMAALLAAVRQTGEIDMHVAWGHDGEYHSSVRLDDFTTVEAFPFWRHSEPSQDGRIGNGRAEALNALASRYPVGVDAVIERVQPDVIHVHGTEGPAGLLLQRHRLPTVVSIQGSAAIWATRYWGSHGWQTRIRHPRSVVNRILFAARGRREAQILRAATVVAGRTRWDERFCHSRAPQAAYYRAYECVRPEFLSVRHRPHPHRTQKRVLTVSSSQPYKGIDLAIAAIARLRASGRNVKLILAGSFFKRGWGSEILDSVAAAGPDAVEMTGYLSAAEIAVRLAEADAFVLPSHIENSPNSLLEAMAAGVPCVAASVGGVRSMLRNGVEGLLFSRGDADALARQLERVLDDADLASRLGHAAAVRARATCRPEEVARDTIRMYERLTGVAAAAQRDRALA